MEVHEIDILLIEDDVHDANLTIRALGKHNFSGKLHHVLDGEEAIDFLFCRNKYSGRNRHDLPRLILLDLKLPKISGQEILSILKKDDRTTSIPVIVLTSSENREDIEICTSFGVKNYIIKPVDFDQFIKCVIDLGLYWLFLKNDINEEK